MELSAYLRRKSQEFEDRLRYIPTSELEAEFHRVSARSTWRAKMVKEEYERRMRERPSSWELVARGGLTLKG